MYIYSLHLWMRISNTLRTNIEKICKVIFLLSGCVLCDTQLCDPAAACVVLMASTWSSWGTAIVSVTLANSGCAPRFPFQTGADPELLLCSIHSLLLSAPSGPYFNHTGLKIGPAVMSWQCWEPASSNTHTHSLSKQPDCTKALPPHAYKQRD